MSVSQSSFMPERWGGGFRLPSGTLTWTQRNGAHHCLGPVLGFFSLYHPNLFTPELEAVQGFQTVFSGRRVVLGTHESQVHLEQCSFTDSIQSLEKFMVLLEDAATRDGHMAV